MYIWKIDKIALSSNDDKRLHRLMIKLHQILMEQVRESM